MQMSWLFLILSLALLTAALSVGARRLDLSSPILALCVGIVVSFLPGVPTVELDPEVVLLLLLPPLLYASGVGMSWRGFRANLRPILLLAIGCVLFTATAVAAVVHYAFGIPWAVGFVLGAIVSPPDAVAPMAILRRWKLPRRLLMVLEGESLVNDATALVVFSLAVNVVATGDFSAFNAAARFGLIVLGEIAFGIAVGWAMLALRHLANEPRAEVLLALITPFLAFWLPHELSGSGVIACVAAGLWVSWHGPRQIRPATRLQGFFIWDLVTWAIESLVFLLTGLQAKHLAAGLTGEGWQRLLLAGALVSLTIVIVRFVWVYPATYLPRFLLPALRRRDPYPDWRLTFLVGFTGLRGVVSLAAALSVPLLIGGKPFPERDLVLFATLCVIVVTLVGQGGLLPWVVSRLGLASSGADEALTNKRNELAVRLDVINAVLAAAEEAANTGGPVEAAGAVSRRLKDRRAHHSATANETTADDPVSEAGALELTLLNLERGAISQAYANNRITDEARRRIERELDLNEARLLMELQNASGLNGMPE
jgi:monovalent cation/hydrogen antiporter